MLRVVVSGSRGIGSWAWVICQVLRRSRVHGLQGAAPEAVFADVVTRMAYCLHPAFIMAHLSG